MKIEDKSLLLGNNDAKEPKVSENVAQIVSEAVRNNNVLLTQEGISEYNKLAIERSLLVKLCANN